MTARDKHVFRATPQIAIAHGCSSPQKRRSVTAVCGQIALLGCILISWAALEASQKSSCCSGIKCWGGLCMHCPASDGLEPAIILHMFSGVLETTALLRVDWT